MAFLACRRAADPVGQQQNRKNDGHDHHLPDLDADVERCQRRRQRVVRQAIFAQRPGKPEAVNETKRKGGPPPLANIVNEKILGRDEAPTGDGERVFVTVASANALRRRMCLAPYSF
jgi:hypothetical protein